jgi:hypothetical protein
MTDADTKFSLGISSRPCGGRAGKGGAAEPAGEAVDAAWRGRVEKEVADEGRFGEAGSQDSSAVAAAARGGMSSCRRHPL